MIFIVYFLLYINFTYAYNVICYAMVHVTWRLCLIIYMDTCNSNTIPSMKLHNYYFHFICLTFTSSLFKLTNTFSWIKTCLEHIFQITLYKCPLSFIFHFILAFSLHFWVVMYFCIIFAYVLLVLYYNNGVSKLIIHFIFSKKIL